MVCSLLWSKLRFFREITLKLLDRAVSGAQFLTGVYLSVTLRIVDLSQYPAYCMRSGVTWCTLLIVLYLDCMCQCGLHAVLGSHIGILMSHLAAEPCRTVWLLFSSVSFWNDLTDPVVDGLGLVGFKSRANAF